jgi:SHAQKYF class myb-like DNA-binding protein
MASGVPWTEDEHRRFLAGLEKLGKGDWRGISRHFVATRTPTQVASHAQKYFLRQAGLAQKKRRSSLFDVVRARLKTRAGVVDVVTNQLTCTNLPLFSSGREEWRQGGEGESSETETRD